MPRVPSNFKIFVTNELLGEKIEESKSNYISNWISIGIQIYATCFI